MNRITWNDIDKDNITLYELSGDQFGGLFMIAEETTQNIYFDYAGEIVGKLMQNGKISWYKKCSRNISDNIRQFIKQCIKENK